MEFRDPSPPSSTLTVTVRAFARYAEVLGAESFTLELDAPATVGDAVAALREQVANGSLIPAAPLVAINREHVHLDRPVGPGEELALLPPLAGG